MRTDEFSTWELMLFLIPFKKYPKVVGRYCDVCDSRWMEVDENHEWFSIEQWEPSETELPAFHKLVHDSELTEHEANSEKRLKGLLAALKHKVKVDREIPQGNPNLNVSKYRMREFTNYGVVGVVAFLIAIFASIGISELMGARSGQMDKMIMTVTIMAFTFPAAYLIYLIVARKKEICFIAVKDKCERYQMDTSKLMEVARTNFEKKVARKIHAAMSKSPKMPAADPIATVDAVTDLTPFQGRSYFLFKSKMVRMIVGIVLALVIGVVLAGIFQFFQGETEYL